MPLYVFALLEMPLRPPLPPGLTGRPVVVRRIGAWAAVVETRRDAPDVDPDVLRRQQDTVERLARRSPAILPVRFGTIVTARELDAAVRGAADDLREAFARVRGRVQMTWRLAAPARRRTGRPSARLSGRAYLASRARQTLPPRRWHAVRSAVGALAAAERYQPGSGGAPDVLYHLVPRAAVRAYLSAADAVRRDLPAARLTGPTAPYAFTPEMLSPDAPVRSV